MTSRVFIPLAVLLIIFTSTTYAAMTVECGAEEMTVEIEMDGSDNVTFYMGDSEDGACELSQNGTHNTFTTGYGFCDIARSDNDTYIIYTVKIVNYLNSTAVINRDPTHQYNVECYLERDVNATSIGNLNVSRITTVNETEDAVGQFDVELRIHSSSTYGGAYNALNYPLEYDIRDPVYAEIKLDTTNFDVMVVPQDCWASSTNDFSAATSHYLFEDRCGKDRTFEEGDVTNRTWRFSFEAFQFQNDEKAVYLFCKIFICDHTSVEPACSFGCARKKRSVLEHRQTRDLTTTDSEVMGHKEIIISTDRLIFITPNDNVSSDQSSSSNALSSSTVIGLLGGVIGVLVVAILMFAFYFKTRTARPTTTDIVLEQKS